MSDKITLLKRRSSFNPFLRTVSALLISGFLAQDVLYANPDIKEIADSVQRTGASPLTPDSSTLYAGKTIFLIQDAHVNESAQRSISEILANLIEKEKIKTVFLEAGTGDDSLSDLRLLADAKKRKDVSERFLRKGYIQGPDYLDLNSGQNFKLWGVEDKALYYQAVGLYRDVQENRSYAIGFVDKVNRALKTLKIKQFHPTLLDFDKKREAYLTNNYSLAEYFKTVSDIAHDKKISLLSYPHFLTLQEVQDKESAIDFQKAGE